MIMSFCLDYLSTIADNGQDDGNNVEDTHTVLVVSPLKSLMKSQVADLLEKGVSAVALLKETTADVYDNIEKGDFSVVFASPEILQKKGPLLLSNPEFRLRICGIFVDEVHIVKQW